MAEIFEKPGQLDITYMNIGYPFTFQTIHDGDLTGNTYVATINLYNGIKIPIGITKSYDNVTFKTTLTYTLTKSNSALLLPNVNQWILIETSGGQERLLLVGKWGAYPI